MFGPEEYESQVILKETGKLPAIQGYDFLSLEEDTPPSISVAGKHPDELAENKLPFQIRNAIDWHKKGGIVTFCWHWCVPVDMASPEKGRAFYTEHTDFDVSKAVNPGTAEHAVVLRHIDQIAAFLKILEKEGVPIIWRPLHEASGKWFWWGAKTAEDYKKLWYLLFDRLENHHKCANLIWVWNGQDKDWTVSPDTYDIAGEDVYPGEHIYTSQKERYHSCIDFIQCDKMIALSENGCLCDPAALLEEEVKWLWWCVWWGEFVFEKDESGCVHYSEKYTERDMLRYVYQHPYVLTLEDLPDLRA